MGFNFQRILNPLCTCGCDLQKACCFLLYCPIFVADRNTLLNKITNIGSNILNQVGATAAKTFLFGNLKYSSEVNLQIFIAIFGFFLTSRRFHEPLLNS